MDPNEQKAILELMPVLSKQILVDDVARFLRVNNFIQTTHHEKILNQTAEEDRTIKLLEIMQRIDDGWSKLCKALNACQQDNLRIKLESKLNEFSVGSAAESEIRPTAESEIRPTAESEIRPTAENAPIDLGSKSPEEIAENSKSFQKTIELLQKLKIEAETIFGHTIVDKNTKETLLHYVALEGDAEVLQELLQQPLNVDVRAEIFERKGFTPMICAALKGNFDCLKFLIKFGANLNFFNEFLRTPLHYAAANDHLDCLKELIANGAKVDAADFNGDTPLHWAAWKGNLNCLKELIGAGANSKLKNKFGRFAFDSAKSNNKIRCAEYLEKVQQKLIQN